MKAIFEFKGEKISVTVPYNLYLISDLTDKIAENDKHLEEETDISDAYDYLEESLRYLFAKHMNLDAGDLSCSFLNPQTDEERDFGCLIEVIQEL